jgi:hypothetical protein
LPGRDDQLGQIFINMRRAMGAPRDAIARRLATRTSTIDDFEAGAVSALPHWKETERIVRGYCELLRLDPQPILWRIRSHLDSMARPPLPAAPSRPPAPGPVPAAAGRPSVMPAPPATRRSERKIDRERDEDDDGPPPSRRRRRMRTLFTLTAPVALLAGVVYAAQSAPRLVYPVIAFLPDRLEIPVRAGLEYMIRLTAPSRDGLRWIEVSDPKMRKADKLQTESR